MRHFFFSSLQTKNCQEDERHAKKYFQRGPPTFSFFRSLSDFFFVTPRLISEWTIGLTCLRLASSYNHHRPFFLVKRKKGKKKRDAVVGFFSSYSQREMSRMSSLNVKSFDGFPSIGKKQQQQQHIWWLLLLLLIDTERKC